MKHKSILTAVAAVLLSLFVQSAYAQNGNGRQTSGGFWVVESNLATPHIVTVRFYEEGKQLIYEEHLTGVRMDVSKGGTRRRLDQSLRDARAAWQESRRVLEDKGLVSARFGISWSKER
jgi:hypothetical protein